MGGRLVVGIDAGGSTTRCVVADEDGTVVGRGVAAGANLRSSAGDPSAALSSALTEALAGIDVGRVSAGTAGVAGAGSAGHGAALAALRTASAAAGLPVGLELITDLEVAFAAATPLAEGILVLAGTGAAAAAISGRQLVHRCDGYGWLLGDEGSAVWLGREALRAVLGALDGRRGATALVDPVCGALLGGSAPGGSAPAVASESAAPADLAQRLLGAAYSSAPAQLGALAPLVSAAALAGDAAARAITGEAVGRLLHAAATVSAALAAVPAVAIAGSVLLCPGPVRDGVLAGLRERHGLEPAPAGDGAGGAAVLALGRLLGRPVEPAVHARLTAG